MDFPYFLVVAGDDKDRKFPVHPGSGHLLGRHSDASYILRDHSVARYACMINSLEGVVEVVDQPGSGGIQVNGVPVKRKDLEHADTLQIGNTMIRFLTRALTEAELHPGVTVRSEYDPKLVDQLASLTGQMFSHFEVGPMLGRGTGAMVFEATDTTTNTKVALKVLQPEFGRHEDDRQRFIKAMRASMPLDHPNLVKVYGAGKSGDYLWAALELVPGQSLASIIKQKGASDWRIAHRIALRVGRALAYIHGHNLLHRDIGPPSVLIRSTDKEIKLEDLMLGKAAAEEGTPGHAVRPTDLIGDVNFMSPERTTGGAVPVDHRSDLYSLGATCYYVMAGKPPFEADSVMELVHAIRSEKPAGLRRQHPMLPPQFEATVLRMMAKHPSDRHHSATELVQELEGIGQTVGLKA